MTIAIWIIAVCEVIRLAQNCIQLYMMQKNRTDYQKAMNRQDVFDKIVDQALKDAKDRDAGK